MRERERRQQRSIGAGGATESEPVKGEDLAKSEDLKRKLVDSKKRITDDNTSRPRS